MTPIYEDPLVTLFAGDCLDVMRELPDASVDSVVTDPPAGIRFMSKNWDHDRGGRTEWVAWMTDVMRECYRVLKPGGYALVWSIPRTCHWTAWAMEDAGFIIRDQLAHIFASGFPKGRAQLKPAREDWWLARKPGPVMLPLGIDACRIGGPDGHGGGARASDVPVNGFGVGGYRKGDGFVASTVGRWPSNVLLSSPELFDEPNPWVVGSGATTTDGVAVERNGGGGAIFRADRSMPAREDRGYGGGGGYSRFFIVPKADRTERERGLAGAPQRETRSYGDREQGPLPQQTPQAAVIRANTHPTVKPIDLMRHLVRLVTPPGGVTLDPFLGSGTTALAASEEGFRCIGIEREAEYLEIAVGRLMATPMGLGLDVPAPTKRRKVQDGVWTTERGYDKGQDWFNWREEGENPEEAA